MLLLALGGAGEPAGITHTHTAAAALELFGCYFYATQNAFEGLRRRE